MKVSTVFKQPGTGPANKVSATAKTKKNITQDDMSKDEKTYYYATFEFIEKTEMTVTSLTGLDNFYKQLEKVFISYYKCML